MNNSTEYQTEYRDILRNRLLNKVKPGANGCWLWTATRFNNGYGSFYSKRFNERRAHRISYIIHKGAIPDGLVVMHTCDTRSCVNPDHLALGTQAENLNDMFSKGRGNRAFGENASRSKLTAIQVVNIKHCKGSVSTRGLAKLYKVSSPAIQAIWSGKTWSRLDEALEATL